MLNGRTRFTTALTTLALTASVALSVSASGPAQAEPDIDQVQARVDRLFHEAEQASERYNDAKLELERLTAELESLESDESRQGDRLDEIR